MGGREGRERGVAGRGGEGKGGEGRDVTMNGTKCDLRSGILPFALLAPGFQVTISSFHWVNDEVGGAMSLSQKHKATAV